MIGTVALTLARQRLASPMRVLLAAVFFGFGIISVLFGGSLAMLGKSQQGLFGFVMAAGLIGQEVSSGVLTLTFARPLRRADYVIGRWLGASALASACVVLQVLVASAVALLRHGDPTASQVALKILEGSLAVTGVSALLLMFSSLVPGLGDLGLLLLSQITVGVLSLAAINWKIGWLDRAATEIHRFLDASLDLAPFFGQGTISWFAVASYLSSLTICVVVAIWAVNRTELSYASG